MIGKILRHGELLGLTWKGRLMKKITEEDHDYNTRARL